MTQTRTIRLSAEDLHAAVRAWLEDTQGVEFEPGDVLTTNMDRSILGVVVTIESPPPVPAEAAT